MFLVQLFIAVACNRYYLSSLLINLKKIYEIVSFFIYVSFSFSHNFILIMYLLFLHVWVIHVKHYNGIFIIYFFNFLVGYIIMVLFYISVGIDSFHLMNILNFLIYFWFIISFSLFCKKFFFFNIFISSPIIKW